MVPEADVLRGDADHRRSASEEFALGGAGGSTHVAGLGSSDERFFKRFAPPRR